MCWGVAHSHLFVQEIFWWMGTPAFWKEEEAEKGRMGKSLVGCYCFCLFLSFGLMSSTSLFERRYFEEREKRKRKGEEKKEWKKMDEGGRDESNPPSSSSEFFPVQKLLCGTFLMSVFSAIFDLHVYLSCSGIFVVNSFILCTFYLFYLIMHWHILQIILAYVYAERKSSNTAVTWVALGQIGSVRSLTRYRLAGLFVRPCQLYMGVTRGSQGWLASWKQEQRTQFARRAFSLVQRQRKLTASSRKTTESSKTIDQPDTKFNPNPNHNPNSTTKQHAVVLSIQLNIVTRPMYPEKFIRDNVAPLLQTFRCHCHSP